MSKEWRGDQLARIPLRVLALVLGITAIVFLISGFVMNGGFERAWEILLGIRRPFGQAAALGVALSALGYVAVPTVIGLGVADFITRFTNARLNTVPQAVEEIEKRVKPKIRKAVKEEVSAQMKPPSDPGSER